MRKFPKHYGANGFTLFELIIAMAIVGLMVGIVVSRVDEWFDTNIKSTTGKLSSTIRYLHDKSSTQNLYIRLIFDFEKNSYWVEATTEQFMLMTKEVEEELKKEEESLPIKTETNEAAEKTEGFMGETDGVEETEPVEKYRSPQFGAVDEFLLKPVSIPDGVFLKDVYTTHDQGPVTSGQAYIYFFPNGYIEPSIINLRDEKDEINYSIEINPLTGSTKIEDRYKSTEKK